MEVTYAHFPLWEITRINAHYYYTVQHTLLIQVDLVFFPMTDSTILNEFMNECVPFNCAL